MAFDLDPLKTAFIKQVNSSLLQYKYQDTYAEKEWSFQTALAQYRAASANALSDYREASAAYSTKKQLYASDLQYLTEQLSTIPTLLETKVSYSESLLANLQNQFQAQSQLLDSKYSELNRQKDINLGLLNAEYGQKTEDLRRALYKSSGEGLSRWAAGGFGSIGSAEAIAREQQSYYARQQAFEDTQTALKRDALDVDYDLQKRLELNLLQTNHQADVLREQYSITTATLEAQSQTADLQNKVEQTKIQQAGLVAPTLKSIAVPTKAPLNQKL